MQDRSSRPHGGPTRTAQPVLRKIVHLRCKPIYLGADTAADAVGNGLVWVRRAALTVAAAALAVGGLRRLRPRQRQGRHDGRTPGHRRLRAGLLPALPAAALRRRRARRPGTTAARQALRTPGGAEKKQPRNLPIAAGHLAAVVGVLAIAFLV